MSTSTTLPPLPAELWTEILSYISAQDLIKNCNPVLKTFAFAVNTVLKQQVIRNRTIVSYGDSRPPRWSQFWSDFSHSCDSDRDVAHFKLTPSQPQMLDAGCMNLWIVAVKTKDDQPIVCLGGEFRNASRSFIFLTRGEEMREMGIHVDEHAEELKFNWWKTLYVVYGQDQDQALQAADSWESL